LIDREKLALHARLKAAETLLEFALAMLYRAERIKPGNVTEMHDLLVSTVSQKSVPGLDPATSDLLTAELSEAIGTLLDRAARLHEMLPPPPRRPRKP
jgi:hypothetical protein